METGPAVNTVREYSRIYCPTEVYDSFAIIDEADDRMSRAIEASALARKIHCRRIRIGDFAKDITIRHANGDCIITPSFPLLLRPLRFATSLTDEPTRFTISETFASVWCAAALTSAPVVNRPAEYGWTARWTFSGAMTEIQASGAVKCPEVFWRGKPPEPPKNPAEQFLHQELESFQTVTVPSNGTYRSRLVPQCRGWERVIVVADRAFRVTTASVGEWKAEEQSIQAARSLGLTFASIGWGITHDEVPFLSRINPFPSLEECAPVWNDVMDSLFQFLGQRGA